MRTRIIIRNIILILLAVAIVVVGTGLCLLWRAQAVINIEPDEVADYTVLINPTGKYVRLAELDNGVRCRLADYMKRRNLVLAVGEQRFLATKRVTTDELITKYFTFTTKQISEGE